MVQTPAPWYFMSPFLVGGAITILKNISQWERLSYILWKIKNVWNHQSDFFGENRWPDCTSLSSPLMVAYPVVEVHDAPWQMLADVTSSRRMWNHWGFYCLVWSTHWFYDVLVGGFNLPLWKIMEFVSWDDDIPNFLWKVIIHSMVPVTTQTTNQHWFYDVLWWSMWTSPTWQPWSRNPI